MNEQRGGHMDGTANAVRLGDAAQQTEPEGLDDEGRAPAAGEAGTGGADAEHGAGVAKPMSEELGAESPEPAAPVGGRADWKFSRRTEPRWRRGVLR